ncbi:hypothetical protein DFP73DRAFT_286432 [Morchella snyderi]|nr:hypothetical protein DFP73DRAFT_286432 [Morchella snyderi]
MGSPHTQKSAIPRKRNTIVPGKGERERRVGRERRIGRERRTGQELPDIIPCFYSKTCGFKSRSEKSIRNHIKRVHIMHLQCDVCGQRFGGTWEFNRHTDPGTKPKSCVMKPFVELPQYVISHGERIAGCSWGELYQAMFSGGEKLYDNQDNTDNLPRPGNNVLINESTNQRNQTSNSDGGNPELMNETNPQPGQALSGYQIAIENATEYEYDTPIAPPTYMAGLEEDLWQATGIHSDQDERGPGFVVYMCFPNLANEAQYPPATQDDIAFHQLFPNYNNQGRVVFNFVYLGIW